MTDDESPSKQDVEKQRETDDEDPAGYEEEAVKSPPIETDKDQDPAIVVSVAVSADDIDRFPLLPTPKHDAKRREMIGGATLVTILILFFVGLTHGVALTATGAFDKFSPVWYLFLVLIYTETVIALVCLAGLFVSDPGVVQRSPETCFPIPAQVETWIQAHLLKTKADSEIIVEPPSETYIPAPDSLDTYCVRCLVWRKANNSGTKYFHCYTCQRCVRHFDHHCSFFGRCIAGKASRGNYKYFKTLIGVGILAYLTTLVSVLWSLSVRFGPEWVLPISFVFLWWLQVTLLSRSPNAVCLCCRRISFQVVETARRCFRQCFMKGRAVDT
jgi:hypothetical protein